MDDHDDEVELSEVDGALIVAELGHLEHHVEVLRTIVERSGLAVVGGPALVDLIAVPIKDVQGWLAPND